MSQPKDHLDYLQIVKIGWERAAERVGIDEHYYSIGDFTILLLFAGTELSNKITPALAHLTPRSYCNPALTIHLWDSQSTNIKLPLLLDSFIKSLRYCWQDLVNSRGEIREYSSGILQSTIQFKPDILNVLDYENNQAFYWTEDAAKVPYYERGSPLRVILSCWMAKREYQYVHAGAIGTPEKGILLVGHGGTGKSTTALASLSSYLGYASDDYCLIGLLPTPYIYSLYNTAKLKGDDDLERFPKLKERFEKLRPEEKAMIFLQEYYAEKIINKLPLKAIILPRITGKIETNWEKTNASIIFKELAPWTILQLPSSPATSLKLISEIVKVTDCYILNIGTDLDQIAKALTDFIEQIT